MVIACFAVVIVVFVVDFVVVDSVVDVVDFVVVDVVDCVVVVDFVLVVDVVDDGIGANGLLESVVAWA